MTYLLVNVHTCNTAYDRDRVRVLAVVQLG